MPHPNEIAVLLDEMRTEQRLLNSACFQPNTGLEAIDPKVFMNALKALGERSKKVLKFVMNMRAVTVEYIPAHECKLNAKVLKVPFTQTGRNVVFQPEGFSGQIAEFLDFLKENEKDMLDVQKALNDANKVFAEYISNPEDLNRMDVKRVPQLEKISDIPSQFGEFFEGADGVDRVEMDAIYGSYADFGSASITLDAVTKKFRSVELKKVKGSINDLYETIDILMKGVERGTWTINKTVAKSIGGLIYNLADWCAVYSLYLSKLVAVSNSHRDTAKKLNGFF